MKDVFRFRRWLHAAIIAGGLAACGGSSHGLSQNVSFPPGSDLENAQTSVRVCSNDDVLGRKDRSALSEGVIAYRGSFGGQRSFGEQRGILCYDPGERVSGSEYASR